MYKIRGADGKEYGPVGAEAIRQWIVERRANGATLVQAEGTSDWKPLSTFAEFSASLTSRANPPTLPPRPETSAASSNVTRHQTSGLAIASLVLAIVGPCTLGIGNLLGIVLGLLALKKIKRGSGRIAGRGLAITGLCLSAATLLLVPVLMDLALPALSNAKRGSRTVSCINNLRQLAHAVRLYAADNSDALPVASKWCELVQPHLATPSAWQCPSDGARNQCSFGFNGNLSGKDESQVNPRAVLLFEMDGGWNASGGREAILSRHGGTYAVAFVDGSVEQVPAGRLSQLRWEP